MKMNLSMMLFTSSLITGTLITISSSSWLLMWIGLEMNLMSFIPLMNNNKTPYESEASMKYFMVQAMASMMLLMSLIMSEFINFDKQFIYLVFLTSMFIKMGAAPFHFWFPGVMQGLSWINCMLIMTWQKIAPMIMSSYILTSGMMSNIIMLTSVIVGAIGGFNQTSIRKIMAYSSISHIGWMIMAMLMSLNYWLMYFLFYSLLSISVVLLMNNNSLFYLSQIFSLKMNNSLKFTLFLAILSLGGLPPFLGFLPKWLIIQNCLLFESNLLIIVMIMMTMITLYFYLRMTYSAFTMNNMSTIWMNQNNNKSIMFMSVLISMAGIPLIVVINLY
uniref:NADH dehydrogenase subunit 2 n=1 Tax=Ischnura senegalensis TaxID=126660 RepID=UPI001BF12797|nr:NADH dehydrogenase subunit 2 [Ischnura senegalensis]QTZ98197.1 NADH dehydrogenase subunit 2 [Ischnura senegalensis]